jgi:hypothetical protein
VPLVGGRVELVTGATLFGDVVDVSFCCEVAVVFIVLDDAGWLLVGVESATLFFSLAAEIGLFVSCCMEEDEFKASGFSELCEPFTGSVVTDDACWVDVGEPSAGFGGELEWIEAVAVDDSSSVAQVGYAILNG